MGNSVSKYISTSVFQCMDALLKKGADPDRSYSHTSPPPLIVATMIENAKAIDLLIKAGADVNKKDFKNKTAICYAAKDDRKDIVRLLLAHGASANDDMVRIV